MNIVDLFGYNWHSRREFLKSMASLPWEKVVENYGASFDCIRDIFVHSLQCEQFWIRSLSGKSVDGIFSTPFTNFPSVNVIKDYADKVEAEANEYLKTLTDKKLKSVFEFKGWDGKIKRHRIGDILMHVVEEEIHHRGELLCIYWQNDIPPPYVSYMAYKGQA